MDVIIKWQLRSCVIAMGLLLPLQQGFAANQTFPGVTAPYSMLATDNILTIQSGNTMQTASSNPSLTYTIGMGMQYTLGTQGNTVTIQPNATVSYAGADSVGYAIFSQRNDTLATTETINISAQGTISSGNGDFAIYMQNSNASAANTVNINNSGIVNGAILTSGPSIIVLNLDGSSVDVNGAINLTHGTGGSSTLNVGKTTAANVSTSETMTNISTLRVFANSSLTINKSANAIAALQVDSGATATINANLGAASSGEAAVTNNGTLIVSSNINKTGSFITSGSATTRFTNIVDVATSGASGYANAGTHQAQMLDVLHYGKMNMTASTTPATKPSFATFEITYGGGYLAAGTYVLVNTPSGIGTAPTNLIVPTATQFLRIGSPTVVGNTIVTTVVRSPYNSYGKTPILRRLGSNLESIGSNTPTQHMATLLNAIEATGNPVTLNSALLQLCPLLSAPLHGFEIQNEGIQQVQLRIASTRDQKYYMAGDAARDNSLWLRPFGNMSNQRAKDDIPGYYASGGGLAGGLDRVLDDKFLLGAGGSYSLSRVIDKANGVSYTKVKTYQMMMYGSYNFKPYKYMDWVMGVAANSYRGFRAINMPTLNLIARSKYSSQLFSAKAIWGRDYSLSDVFQVTPLGSLQYTFTKQYAYTETEAAGANLTVSRDNSNIVQAGAGLKLALPLNLDPAVFIPEVHIMGLYNIINGPQNSTFNFVEGGTTVNSIMLMSRMGAKFGASVTFAVLDHLDVKLNYDHEARDRYTNNSFYLNFKYTF